jgi:hypothetical protein
MDTSCVCYVSLSSSIVPIYQELQHDQHSLFSFTIKLPTGSNFHPSYISLVMVCVMIQTFLTWVLVVEYNYLNTYEVPVAAHES